MRSALVLTIVATLGCAGGAGEVRETPSAPPETPRLLERAQRVHGAFDIVEHARRERERQTEAAGRALIERGASDATTERRVQRAWRSWYDEARASIEAWPGR